MSPHLAFPLRRIVRREVQGGTDVVLLACGHSALGRPQSRFSRFYPCAACHEHVEAMRAAHTKGSRTRRRAA